MTQIEELVNIFVTIFTNFYHALQACFRFTPNSGVMMPNKQPIQHEQLTMDEFYKNLEANYKPAIGDIVYSLRLDKYFKVIQVAKNCTLEELNTDNYHFLTLKELKHYVLQVR
jgi:hypothetical protein